ncbi:MAG: sigma-54 dependent transcriptional regulator [Kiritimatiellia bacterium]
MADQPVILIVDDDKNTRDGLQRALQRHYDVYTAESADAALEVFGRVPDVDVMLSDLRMPGVDGIGLLQRVHGQHPRTVCILLTAYGSVEAAVEAMKRGAYDFLTKPINLDHLDMLISRAVKSRDLEQKVESLKSQLDEKFGMENIIGESDAMKQVFDVVRQAAPTQASVLIQGPSGTGKELIAKAVHRLSTRSKGPFIAVHCAALSSSLLESELFGHEKGAFTGADFQRKGRFEMADGGTLFLDEISEIDTAMQVKLLRVLEERTFERVGGQESVEVDIRLIAATNRDLREYVADNKFREDLFFRLNVVDIMLPPLKARDGDVPLLIDRFLKEFAEKNNKNVDGMTSDAVSVLEAYQWPGNVRELRNTVEKMVVLARGERLTLRDVPANIRESATLYTPGGRSQLLADGSLADTEERKIMAVLEKNKGNKTRASQELGISRRTLHRKLHEYRMRDEKE